MLSVVFLWRVLAALKIPGAVLAAALFAVHPVNVESVAWVTERKNTLCMLFYLLSVFAYLRFDDVLKPKVLEEKATPAGASRSPRSGSSIAFCYVLSLIAFVLALLSKSAVAPLPVVLLGVIWWRRGRVSLRDFLRTIPFFALAAAAGMISIWFQYHRAIGASMVAVRHDSFLSRLAGAGWAVWFYLYKALVPVNLSFVYPRWRVDGGHLLAWLPDFLLLMVFVVLWCGRRGWGKAALFGLAYFVVMLLPVLGFLNIYFMRYSLVADHWQYFAIIGPITFVAAGIAALSRAGAVGWSRGLGVGLVGLFGFLAWQENRVYQNVETLWVKTLERNPAATLALNNLGTLRLQAGKLDEAASCFQRALEIQPDAPDVLSNLGAARLRQGRLDDAVVHFRRALELEPGSAQANNNLGEALLQQGKFDEALVHFRKVAEIQPNTAAVEDNLGEALFRAGEIDEALIHLAKAVALQPASAEFQINLGNALLREGRQDFALAHLRKAVELRPDMALAHYNLANALLQSAKLDEAGAEYRRTLELDPVFVGAYNGLGNVLLRQGRADEAAAKFRQALTLAPELAEAHFNLANILLQKNELDEAITHLEKGLAAEPRAAGPQNNLASALLQKGRTDEAIVHLRAALELQPNLPQAQNNLANALLGKGKVAEAVKHYEAAIAAVPNNPYLLNNLAWVLATCPDAAIRNGPRALELAKRANELAAGKTPAFLGTVAAAQAELGKYSDAATTAQQALDLATAQGNTAQMNSLRDRLGIYKNGSPYRDSELTPR